MTTILDLYSAQIEPLPPRDRLRLAALILEGLAATPEAVDFSTGWSEEDLRDLGAFSLAAGSAATL